MEDLVVDGDLTYAGNQATFKPAPISVNAKHSSWRRSPTAVRGMWTSSLLPFPKFTAFTTLETIPPFVSATNSSRQQLQTKSGVHRNVPKENDRLRNALQTLLVHLKVVEDALQSSETAQHELADRLTSLECENARLKETVCKLEQQAFKNTYERESKTLVNLDMQINKNRLKQSYSQQNIHKQDMDRQDKGDGSYNTSNMKHQVAVYSTPMNTEPMLVPPYKYVGSYNEDDSGDPRVVQDPIYEENNQDPIYEESNQDPICEESNQDPIYEESNQDSIYEESNQGTISEESNQYRSYEESNQDLVYPNSSGISSGMQVLTPKKKHQTPYQSSGEDTFNPGLSNTIVVSVDVSLEEQPNSILSGSPYPAIAETNSSGDGYESADCISMDQSNIQYGELDVDGMESVVGMENSQMRTMTYSQVSKLKQNMLGSASDIDVAVDGDIRQYPDLELIPQICLD